MPLVDGAEAPEGVTLRDPEDFTSLRKNIYDRTLKEFSRVFPVSSGGMRLSVSDLAYKDPEDYSIDDELKAKLSDRFLSRRLEGTLNLEDEATGKVLENKRVTLMRVPYLTRRGTYIHGGNEYTLKMQARLTPGAYARRRENGEVEMQTIVRPDSGVPFRVALEPETGQFRLRVKGSDLHLYSLLRDMGYEDKQLERAWGRDLLQRNAAKYDSRVFQKAVSKFVFKGRQKPDASREEQLEALREAFSQALVHRKVVERTLPALVNPAKQARFWVRTMLDKQAADLEFKPDYTPDQLRDVYAAIYGGYGPQLASMKEWPKSWFPPGSDELGWLQWYENYHNGRRGPDDERQIARWRRMRRTHGNMLQRNPTPRRAFALRNWAIDPLKLIEDPKVRETLAGQMLDYKEREERKWQLKQAAFRASDYKTLAVFLNQEHGAGINPDQQTDALAESILRFIDDNPTSVDVAAFSDAADQAASQARAQQEPKVVDFDSPELPKPLIPLEKLSATRIQTPDDDASES